MDMAKPGRITVICVDMGMTGSAAQWKDNQDHKNWIPVFKSKVPTSIAYSPSKEVKAIRAWGTECLNLPFAAIHERFKVYFGKNNFHKSEESGGPASRAELHRWCHDYLQQLSAAIVQEVDENIGAVWKEFEVHWEFTIPGSWDFTAALDFKHLAETAVLLNFSRNPSVHVRCDVTEAVASAMAVMVNGFASGEPLYSIGNLIITCDIGGSSTDIAVAHINGPGTLNIMEQFTESPLGVVTVEREFRHQVSKALRSAGILQPEAVARELLRGKKFQNACQAFVRKDSQDCLAFRLPSESTVNVMVDNLISATDKSTQDIRIDSNCVLIQKTTFASFFDQFTTQIEVAIDGIINKLKPNLTPRRWIPVQFVMDRIRRRYEDHHIPVLDYSRLIILPEMATVTGGTLLWDQNQVRDFIRKTRIGIETTSVMFWKEGRESPAPTTFRIPFRWTVSFSCSKIGDFKEHYILATPKLSSVPKSRNEALAVPGSHCWKVQVKLHKEGREPFSVHKKYEVVCDIIGVGIMDIKVLSLLSGELITSKVMKVQGFDEGR